MKISARNAFSGRIVDIKKGPTTSHITIDANGTKITAAITTESVDDLGLKVGADAMAIVKASNVMVATA